MTSILSKPGCSVQDIQGAGLVCPHRYDRLTQSEADPHLEELLGLVVWLTTCGRSELKVFDSITYPQLEVFKFHHEASGGSRCLWVPCALTRQCRSFPASLCRNKPVAAVSDPVGPDSVMPLGDYLCTENLSLIHFSKCPG